MSDWTFTLGKVEGHLRDYGLGVSNEDGRLVVWQIHDGRRLGGVRVGGDGHAEIWRASDGISTTVGTQSASSIARSTAAHLGLAAERVAAPAAIRWHGGHDVERDHVALAYKIEMQDRLLDLLRAEQKELRAAVEAVRETEDALLAMRTELEVAHMALASARIAKRRAEMTAEGLQAELDELRDRGLDALAQREAQ